MAKEENQVDMRSFTVQTWLHEKWSPAYWGWSLCESNTEKALMLRVPDFYYVGSKRVYTSDEHRFFNTVRIPLRCRHCEKEHGMTVTFDFTKLPVLTWDKVSTYFEDREKEIRDSLATFPKFFYMLEQLELGKLDAHTLKEECGNVFELWEW